MIESHEWFYGSVAGIGQLAFKAHPDELQRGLETDHAVKVFQMTGFRERQVRDAQGNVITVKEPGKWFGHQLIDGPLRARIACAARVSDGFRKDLDALWCDVKIPTPQERMRILGNGEE